MLLRYLVGFVAAPLWSLVTSISISISTRTGPGPGSGLRLNLA